MTTQDLQLQEKQEQRQEQGEKTEVSRDYIPPTDIHETPEALFVTMDMPGVRRDNVDIQLDKNVLTVNGCIDFSNYQDLKPIYTEYNVGHYTRSFTLSSQIDQEGISARMVDGVLALHLPKTKAAAARRIEIQ